MGGEAEVDRTIPYLAIRLFDMVMAKVSDDQAAGRHHSVHDMDVSQLASLCFLLQCKAYHRNFTPAVLALIIDIANKYSAINLKDPKSLRKMECEMLAYHPSQRSITAYHFLLIF